MANAARLLSRMRANPRDWRIEDLKVVADKYTIRQFVALIDKMEGAECKRL
jgi:hypothetical protein